MSTFVKSFHGEIAFLFNYLYIGAVRVLLSFDIFLFYDFILSQLLYSFSFIQSDFACILKSYQSSNGVKTGSFFGHNTLHDSLCTPW